MVRVLSKYLWLLIATMALTACDGFVVDNVDNANNSDGVTDQDDSTTPDGDIINRSEVMYEEAVHKDVVVLKCTSCHNVGGIAAVSNLILSEGDLEASYNAIYNYFTLIDKDKLLTKPLGIGHGGSKILDEESELYTQWRLFIESMAADVAGVTVETPTNLTLRELPTGLVLEWTSTVADDVTYDLWTKKDSGQWLSKHLDQTTTSTFISTLEDASSYQFKVNARKNGVVSEYSNIVDFTSPEARAPYAPSNLTFNATPNSTDVNLVNVTLNWKSNSSNEDLFIVTQTLNNVLTTKEVAQATTSSSFNGLVAGNTYYFSVAAKNESGTSEQSNQVTVVTVVAQKPDAGDFSQVTAVLSDPNSNIVDFSWNYSGSSASSFEIQKQIQGGSWLTDSVVTNEVTSVAIDNLLSGSTYSFRVRAKNVAGESLYVEASTTVATPDQVVAINTPQAPSNFTAENVGGTVTLTWTDNADNEDSFAVYRRTGSEGTYELLSNAVAANATSFQDNNPILDTENRYMLMAVNQSGSTQALTSAMVDLTPNVGSCSAPAWSSDGIYAINDQVVNDGQLFSCLVSGWCTNSSTAHYEPSFGSHWNEAWELLASCGDGGTVEETSPVKPTNLSTSVVNKTLTITWFDQAKNEDNYELWQKFATGAFAKAATLAADSEVATVELTEFGDYTFYLKAVNSIGTTDSDQVVVSLQEPKTTAPDSPTNLLVLLDAYQATISWQSTDSSTTDFEIQQKIGSGEFTTLEVIDAANKSYVLQGLTPSTDYQYQVAAQNAYGSSAFTAPYEITTQALAPPVAPSGLNAALTGTDARITWIDNSSTEDDFQVFMKVNDGAAQSVAIVAKDETSLIVSDLEFGNSYTFYVIARNDEAGNSAQSNESSVTPLSKPDAIFGLEASLEGTSASLTWTLPSNANLIRDIEIYRQENTKDFQMIDSITGDASSYVDTTTTSGNSYRYFVYATNTVGRAPASNKTFVSLMDPANQTVFEEKCSACHNANPSSNGDLTVLAVSEKWENSTYNEFLVKVKTMSGSCAVGDNDCFNAAATYIWNEVWGNQLAAVNLGAERGVRGLRLLTPYEIQNSLEDIFSVTLDTSSLPSPKIDAHFIYDNRADDGALNYEDSNQYLLMAENLAGQIAPTSLNVATIGKKMFRRPLTNAEVALYDELKAESDQAVLTSMIISPYFLYRSELGTWDANEEAYQLSDHEVATALSYQLWGTTPPDSLLTLADNNQLSTSAQIRAQAESMMADEQFADHMYWFVAYYTKTYGDLQEKNVDPITYPQGSDLTLTLAQDMRTEQKLAVKELLMNGNATINELFNPGYTFVNDALATHYGITGNASADAQEFFEQNISNQIIETTCSNCHKSGGNAGNSNLIFIQGNSSNNFAVLEGYHQSNAQQLADKPRNIVSHGGGDKLSDATNESNWLTLMDQLAGNGGDTINFTSNFVKVATDRNRGGLLHQGIFQAKNSDAASTSLVKRGKTIREHMMCHTLGVPSGVMPEEIDVNSYGTVTTRERWDIITGPLASNGECWACHQLMNEPGSALEGFDWTGKFRTTEPAFNDHTVTKDIDAAGVLRDNAGDLIMTNYSDARELTNYMANESFIRECLVDNLYRFNFGHISDVFVENDVATLKSDFAADGKIKDVIGDMFATDSFLLRVDR